jgi:predicted nucleic acid-binding protein
MHLLRAMDLSIERGLSVWDSLIVGAAASAGCETLNSEDFSPGSTLAGMRVVNPFR